MKLAQNPHTGRSISTPAVLRGSRRRRACAVSVGAAPGGIAMGFKVLLVTLREMHFMPRYLVGRQRSARGCEVAK